MRSRLHAIIRGRVQGVGFRDATLREARRLGLAGWVRNRLDGAVEVTAEGPAATLRELEGFLRKGPRMANVTGAEVFWEDRDERQASPTAEHQRPDAPKDRLELFEIR